MEFNVGDRVRANSKSNDYYAITNEESGYYGTVTNAPEDGFMFVGNGTDEGNAEYYVLCDCFDRVDWEVK